MIKALSHEELQEVKIVFQRLLEMIENHIQKPHSPGIMLDITQLKDPRLEDFQIEKWLKYFELEIGYLLTITFAEKYLAIYQERQTYKKILNLIERVNTRTEKDRIEELVSKQVAEHKEEEGVVNLYFDDNSSDNRYIIYHDLDNIYRGLKIKNGKHTLTYILLKHLIDHNEITYQKINQFKKHKNSSKGKEILVGSKGISLSISNKLKLPKGLQIFVDDPSRKKIIINEVIRLRIMENSG